MRESKDILNRLLWATIEDYAGLWELHWEVNSALNLVSSSNKKIAEKILVQCLETGHIKLYYDVWGDNRLQAINQQEALEILKDDKYWHPPNIHDLCVKVGSTNKGEKYYNEKLIDDNHLS